jgi:hypothetical protein
MTVLGSFSLSGKRIDVQREWSDIDGIFHRLIQADPRKEVARTGYRGFRLSEGVELDEAALIAGLRDVLRKQRGLPALEE